MSYSKNNGFDAIFKLFYSQIPRRFRIFDTLLTMEMPHYFNGKGAFNFFPTFAGRALLPR